MIYRCRHLVPTWQRKIYMLAANMAGIVISFHDPDKRDTSIYNRISDGASDSSCGSISSAMFHSFFWVIIAPFFEIVFNSFGVFLPINFSSGRVFDYVCRIVFVCILFPMFFIFLPPFSHSLHLVIFIGLIPFVFSFGYLLGILLGVCSLFFAHNSSVFIISNFAFYSIAVFASALALIKIGGVFDQMAGITAFLLRVHNFAPVKNSDLCDSLLAAGRPHRYGFSGATLASN